MTPQGVRPRRSFTGRVVSWLVRSPLGGRLGRSLVVLRIRGRRSGRILELPVQYAVTAGGIVIYPGRPETKLWWRNLRGGAALDVLRDGTWHHAGATVLDARDAEYAGALGSYQARWPRVRVPTGDPLVLVTWLDERDLTKEQ